MNFEHAGHRRSCCMWHVASTFFGPARLKPSYSMIIKHVLYVRFVPKMNVILLQPASGSEFKLNEAPRINLSKTEQDWATIVHGPESDSEMEEQNLL